MATELTVWQDNKGIYHSTKELADRAELVYVIAELAPGQQRAKDIAEWVVDNVKTIRDLFQASPYRP